MDFEISYRNRLNILLILLCCLLQNCHQELTDEIVIYSNDFSDEDIEGIENAMLNTFDGNKVLGFYNNGELKWNFQELPDHKAVRITLDIFLHDSWDGNLSLPSGPDIWYLNVDNEAIINTTFSTSPCNPRYCLFQSYPENYPSNLNPKTGSLSSDFLGRCHMQDELGYTSRYVITKVVPHKSDYIEITMGDILVQENSDNPLCDESWSLNGITISVLHE
ncbi:hypothetical protein IFO69_10015 [Echinicola sp. CAU 1574]|uniref:Uncharacterized protein n=1 Tax=Echinicola arenosa TaxID=2774144 RepID=A0ABR9AL74_9BACT|nr:hypothetical protein [Echinicola arenosa]MBD8489081.1 hypothetical protein [Echinicola arenosa]